MASLYVIRGRDQGTRFELEDSSIAIGRDASSGIQLHDTEVSRNHVELRRSGDAYTVCDLGSSNGTFINGQRIEEQQLASGDQLQMGRSLMLYSGFVHESSQDLLEQIDIVSRRAANDGSRIVHAMGQGEGSSLLMDSSDAVVDTPWLARARSNLQIMYRTALAVSHTLDIDELLSRIMDMIFEWVEADRGCIMLKDQETGALKPKVRRQRQGVKTDEKITISKTILDFVVDRNEGVLTSNAREDERWDPGHSILQAGVREAICVPMQGRYDVVGVIYIDTSITPQQILQRQGAANKFTQEHLKLMIAIAHQAALAVEDTSYYKAMVQSERMAAVGQTIAMLSHHIKNVLQGIRSGSYLIEMGLEDHDKAAASLAELEKAVTDPNDQPGALDKEESSSSEEESSAENLDEKSHSNTMVESADTIRKGWQFVERNQERITALVMDMLTFSKDREPSPEASDLNEITSEVVELMQARAEEAEVEIAWKPDESMPTLMFDPEGLHRSILNVVTNAIDACAESEKGQVEVSTQHSPIEGLARVVIRDNGSGIEPEDLEQIFTIFVSHKGGRGTGLGLPVSQKILKEHGGQIHVESDLGSGSVFTLELPALRDTGHGQVPPRHGKETLENIEPTQSSASEEN